MIEPSVFCTADYISIGTLTIYILLPAEQCNNADKMCTYTVARLTEINLRFIDGLIEVPHSNRKLSYISLVPGRTCFLGPISLAPAAVACAQRALRQAEIGLQGDRDDGLL